MNKIQMLITPISFLFSIVPRSFIVAIRQEKGIKGVKIREEETKMSLFANYLFRKYKRIHMLLELIRQLAFFKIFFIEAFYQVKEVVFYAYFTASFYYK